METASECLTKIQQPSEGTMSTKTHDSVLSSQGRLNATEMWLKNNDDADLKKLNWESLHAEQKSIYAWNDYYVNEIQLFFLSDSKLYE